MAVIDIDLRFVDVTYELWALREYREVLERQLIAIRSDLEAQLKARLKGEDDEEEQSLAHQEHDELAEHILPRMFRCPLLVSLFAVYESGVTDVAEYVRGQRGATLRLDDMRRADFLDRAKLYFEHVLHFPLVRSEGEWHRLRMLATLRNMQAHANGRSRASPPSVVKKLYGWEQLGVELHFGRLEISETFLRSMLETVDGTLSDLVARAQAI
jgi:hypothetical protein